MRREGSGVDDDDDDDVVVAGSEGRGPWEGVSRQPYHRVRGRLLIPVLVLSQDQFCSVIDSFAIDVRL